MPRRGGHEAGGIVILFALLAVVLIGFLAMSIDIGRLYLVRAELQAAADAGALAGASRRFGDSGAIRQWVLSTVQLNRADQRGLADALVEVGYWGGGTTPAFAAGTTPPASSGYLPAVRVTVARDGSAEGTANGGPMGLLFAPVLGLVDRAVVARSVSVSSAPTFAPSGFLMPLAIPMCIYERYWDPVTGQPLQSPPPEIILQTQQSSSCTGIWTTFDADSSSNALIVSYFYNGSPVDYRIGDLMQPASGTRTSLYSRLESEVLQNQGYRDRTVMVPVVRPDPGGSNKLQVVAFAPVQLTRSVGGSTQAVYGRLVANHTLTTEWFRGGEAPYLGAATQPLIVE